MAGESNGPAALRCKCGNRLHPISGGDAAVIFPPPSFLGLAEEICPRNVMVDADFNAARAADVLLGLMSAGAIQRIGFLVVDPLDLEAFMSVVPMTLPIDVQ
jgi:hypothetical protein